MNSMARYRVKSIEVIARQFKTNNEADDKGFIKTDMLLSQQGKIYFKLNDWKPEKSFNPTQEQVAEDLSADSIPF